MLSVGDLNLVFSVPGTHLCTLFLPLRLTHRLHDYPNPDVQAWSPHSDLSHSARATPTALYLWRGVLFCELWAVAELLSSKN